MKCGFVGLIGRPNAGKSTLLNALLKEKVAIVSEKPQTTRSEIRGIYNSETAQIIFTDTPGIHKPRNRLGSRLNKQASFTMLGVDLIYLFIDASVESKEGDEYVLRMLESVDVPVFLILNKVDLISKEKIMVLLQQWQSRYPFAEFFPLSALKDPKFTDLISTTEKYLPESPVLYPTDMTSDQSENFRIAEIIREQVFLQTEEEVPHATAVYVENKKSDSKGVYLQAVILVERSGQKGIIIGKQGAQLKKIGTNARKELEALLKKKVYLELFVRVEKDWRDQEHKITELGYGFIDE